MSPLAYLCIVLALAIPATYGVMKLQQIRAVSVAYVEGEKIGAGKVAAETTKHASNTVAAVDEGERTAEASPADKAKLQELCNRMASCRDRKR